MSKLNAVLERFHDHFTSVFSVHRNGLFSKSIPKFVSNFTLSHNPSTGNSRPMTLLNPSSASYKLVPFGWQEVDHVPIISPFLVYQILPVAKSTPQPIVSPGPYGSPINTSLMLK